MTDDKPGREGQTRRQIIAGGAMLATAGIAYARTPTASQRVINPNQLEGSVPLRIGSWSYETKSGLVLPPPDEYAKNFYDGTLTRTYTSPTELPIMLLIGYGSSESGMLQVHRPETCYPASGFHLSDIDRVATPVLGGAVPCNYFTAISNDRVEQLLYWVRIGTRFPQRWIEQRFAVFDANLEGWIPDGLLVRISTITTDKPGAQAAIRRFVADMGQACGPAGRKLLFGPSGMPPAARA